MAEINPNVIDITGTPPDSLEILLTRMSQYGKVRLGQYGNDGTWSCDIEMNIRMPNVEFKISSGFKHTTPRSAVLKADELMQDAIRKIKASI